MGDRQHSRKKVFIAMSGGVDSSVAAALLLDQGYEVIGVMMNLWANDSEQQDNECCTPESIKQARSVAEQLKIPFHVLDAKAVFKKMVVDTFIAQYEEGLTPNPCFQCNQTMKWGYLLNIALGTGADYFATGHYAKIDVNSDGHYLLKKAKDPHKDQSYVLSGLTQDQLRHTLLPLGGLTKSEVREIAKAKSLEVANKPDSQDLCFVGKDGYREFINRFGLHDHSIGEIHDIDGSIVGMHNGLSNYTIGQRKGLGSGFSQPVYVIDKKISENLLIIGTSDQLGTKKIHTKSINWIQNPDKTGLSTYQVKIRYKANPVSCKVEVQDSGKFTIILDESVRDATPGQIAVIYNQEDVIGCGQILSTERN